VHAIEKLQSTLQHYSAEREVDMLTTVPSPVSSTAAENPGSHHAELMLLEDIDYIYLANNLTSERRIQMFQFIGEIASDLYQQNWHDLLTNKKYAQDQEPIPIDEFPKSKSPFVHLMIGTVPTPAGLNWGFHEFNNQRIIIKTPSKSMSAKS
jgi:hypothetical protein